MKHTFTAGIFRDAQADDTQGGGFEAISKSIKELGDAQKKQVEGVKENLTKSIEDFKSDSEERLTRIAATAQKALEEAEGVRSELASVKSIKVGEQQTKSFSQAIKEAVETQTDEMNKFARGESKSLTLDVKGFDVKAVGDVTTANVTGSTNWGAQARGGIIMNQNTMTHVRSLLPVRQAGPGTDYYFMRENGNGEGAPAGVLEGDEKAQFDIDLVESSVKFETIAGWMDTTRKAMNNIPNFTQFLQARLPEKLLDVEDQQILYGTGTSPQIKGILVSGNFTAGSAAGATPLAEKIINDLSLLEDTHKRLATGIVMRPAHYYSFFKNKAAGSGEYDLPQGVVFVNGVLYILGIPVAKTTALATNDYVVGDFVRGAELLIQEGMRIDFSYENKDNFTKNKVTIRIEETIALPVYGNNYFVKGSAATS